ncbi:hypothetical protein FORC82_p183 (plasmid) [Escherichia coli]|nr:hypothetical protein FORC82_p183 [Escherichia coli]
MLGSQLRMVLENVTVPDFLLPPDVKSITFISGRIGYC